MNKVVSFPIAKLLKEKGFDGKSNGNFNLSGVYTSAKYNLPNLSDKQDVYILTDWNNFTDMAGNSEYYTAPTMADVVMWLYEKHGIWIYSYPVQPLVFDDEEYPKTVWVVKCLSMNQIMFEKFIDAKNCLAINHHASPTEAYEAAFEHTLNNLIKTETNE